MTIEFNCPSCQKHYRVKDELAGKRAKCKECGGVLDVPAPAVAAEPVAAEPVDVQPVDAGPPSCADLFSATAGYVEVCPGMAGQCVLVIDVDPARRTCDSVCAGAGWTCAGASGAASTSPRCDESPSGACNQNLRIQVCACRP